jgi:hypothetical protein
VVIIVVIVIVVAVRFVVRIAVATHGTRLFSLLGRRSSKPSRIRDFAMEGAAFAGLTLLRPGP